jgi:hypothetical protein
MSNLTTGEFFEYSNPLWVGKTVNIKKLEKVYVNNGEPDAFITGTYDRYSDETLKYATLRTQYGLNDGIGRLVGTLAYGSDGGPTTTSNVNKLFRHATEPGTNPIQNPFGHNPSATKPFYDATATNTGDGTLQLTDDGWTNPDYPQMFRLNITTGGGVGAGKYQFWVRNHFSFDNNFYRDQYRVNPTMSSHNTAEFFEGFVISTYDTTNGTLLRNKRPTIIKMNKRTIIAILEDDICIIDLQTGEGKRFHVSLYPSFNPTSISQVEINETTQTIWVACRVSGLYKIVDPLGTPAITLYDNVVGGSPHIPNCYGVKYGNGRLWAAFEGDIYYTLDEGSLWTAINFDTTGTEISSWNKISNLVPDPSSVDHRMAVVYWVESSDWTDARICWWDNVSGTITVGQGPIVMAMKTTGHADNSGFLIGNKPYTYFTLLAASSTQGKFATSTRRTSYSQTPGRPAYFTFGTNTITQSALYGNNHLQFNQFGIDEEGNESIIMIADSDYEVRFYKDNDTASGILYKAITDHDMGYEVDMIRNGVVMHMGDGVFLLFRPADDSPWHPQQYAMVTLSEADNPDGGTAWSHQIWRKFGWNGSAWELGHAESKTIHATSEELIDNINVSFGDDGGTQTFVAGDYYTNGVVDGIWLDGSTTVDHKTRVYMKATLPTQTDTEFATLPVTTSQGDHTIGHSTFTPWEDDLNTRVGTDYLRRTDDGSFSGARSPQFSSSYGGSVVSDGRFSCGHVRWEIYSNYYFDHADPNQCSKLFVGLSLTSVLGTPISYASINYGIFIDAGTHPGTNTATVYVVEHGVTKLTHGAFDFSDIYDWQFSTTLIDDGSINYKIWHELTGWVTMYTSPAGTAPHGDYCMDIYLAGTSSTSDYVGVKDLYMSTNVPNDYYLNLGDSVNQTGRWEPEFYIIDPYTGLSVIIDGTSATKIAGYDDSTTTLNTGEFSIFRNGQLRYSGADIGKTISAEYVVILNE